MVWTYLVHPQGRILTLCRWTQIEDLQERKKKKTKQPEVARFSTSKELTELGASNWVATVVGPPTS
jgi:hypothetical protein